MGPARLDWRDIPLARGCDTPHVPLALGRSPTLSAPAWAIRTRPSSSPMSDAVDLAALGPELEHDRLFPERANIGVAQILSRERLRLRVWERGAGLTPACGTGACAALVAARGAASPAPRASRRRWRRRSVEWRDDGHVLHDRRGRRQLHRHARCRAVRPRR